MRPSAWVMVAALLLAARTASGQPEPASTYRAVIDRADLEPASIGGWRLRVYVSALSLNGDVLPLDEPNAIKLTAGGTEVRAPYALGTFAAAQTDLAIVFVIQATGEYADVLRLATEAAGGLLEQLPERTQVGIITYGEAVGAAKLGSLKAARSRMAKLSIEGAVAEPALLDALDRALPLLKRAKTQPEGRPLRKMIVVVSDGRDRSGDRERVTKLGERSAREGVRIHTFAHAPDDIRRPLLLLGELSKRSFGTFRWLRKDATTIASWQARFQQLRSEVMQQYVLTYFVDNDLSGQKLKLSTTGRTVLTSLNEGKVPAAACNGDPCETGYCAEVCTQVRAAETRGVFGWLLLVVGIALGAIVLLGLIGYVMTKRQQARAAGPGVPGSVPPGARPASRPPGSQPPGSQPAAYPSAPPAPLPPPTSGPRLYIMQGTRAGETLGLRHGFSIGNAPNNDLVIADGFTSGHHAQIGMDAQGNCWLADLGSTNGTFINGVRVTQKMLDHGVSIKIGSTEIRFLAQ